LNASGNGSIIPSGIGESHRTIFQAYPGETVVWRTYLPDNSLMDEVTFRNSFTIFRQQDCKRVYSLVYGADGGFPNLCPSADDLNTPDLELTGIGRPMLEEVIKLLPDDLGDELRYVDFDGIIVDARGISGSAVSIAERMTNIEMRLDDLYLWYLDDPAKPRKLAISPRTPSRSARPDLPGPSSPQTRNPP
jgi:hypothetical protein